MDKKILLLIVLVLSACSGNQEEMTSEYGSLNCKELREEYYRVLKFKVEAFNQRMKDNDMSLFVTIPLNVISGYGQSAYTDSSLSEIEAENRLDVLRKVLRNKNCNKEGSYSYNQNDCPNCKETNK